MHTSYKGCNKVGIHCRAGIHDTLGHYDQILVSGAYVLSLSCTLFVYIIKHKEPCIMKQGTAVKILTQVRGRGEIFFSVFENVKKNG